MTRGRRSAGLGGPPGSQAPIGVPAALSLSGLLGLMGTPAEVTLLHVRADSHTPATWRVIGQDP